jgi:cellulose synthase/poly-beta-1,6-N-acetylglucosamine synthase-like glycosyltransferase
MTILVSILFVLPLFLVLGGVLYVYTLSLASLKPGPALAPPGEQKGSFAVAIPAHNEAGVIGRTVHSILSTSYPNQMLKVFIVADHCSDETAAVAHDHGATVFERREGERGKGAALSWLFQHILEADFSPDFVVIFDADTCTDPRFFDVMSRRFLDDCSVIQGKHMIRNPQSGWFPSLTWAMFLIEDRYENLGRCNLGLSAKNKGDSIAFRTSVLRQHGWGEGLTEDFEFRQKLLLQGIRIFYEPGAIGYGDAAQNWREASAQRQRWLRGSYQASRKHDRQMLVQGIRSRNWAMIDGALHAILPAYSTLSMLSSVFLASSIILRSWLWDWIPWGWAALFSLLFLFPLLNLAFDRAPLRAFLVILSGPVFIVWRTWLGIYSRFIRRQVEWVRTPRH